MPLDPDVKSKIRDRISTANKSNVDEIIAEVEKLRADLPEDDKDYARASGWLEDLALVKGGGVPGKFS